MATVTEVETVRGPVPTAELGTHAHARARLRADARQPGQLVRRVGRGVPGGRGDREADGARRRGRPHHRRPHRRRPGPGHPPRRPRQRGGPRPATSCPPPACTRTPTSPASSPSGARRPARPARADGRPVRARHPRGHPGHRHQGRVLQVRHRPPRPHARRRAGHAGRGAGPRRDRGADHGPQPPGRRTRWPRCGGCWARRASTRGGSSSPTSATPPTSTCSPGWPRQGFLLGMDRFGIDADPRLRGPGRHRGRAVPARAGRTAWCSPTTPRATSTGSSPTCCAFLPNWNFLHIHEDVRARAARAGRHRRTRSTRCSSATPATGSSAPDTGAGRVGPQPSSRDQRHVVRADLGALEHGDAQVDPRQLRPPGPARRRSPPTGRRAAAAGGPRATPGPRGRARRTRRSCRPTPSARTRRRHRPTTRRRARPRSTAGRRARPSTQRCSWPHLRPDPPSPVVTSTPRWMRS